MINHSGIGGNIPTGEKEGELLSAINYAVDNSSRKEVESATGMSLKKLYNLVGEYKNDSRSVALVKLERFNEILGNDMDFPEDTCFYLG